MNNMCGTNAIRNFTTQPLFYPSLYTANLHLTSLKIFKVKYLNFLKMKRFVKHCYNSAATEASKSVCMRKRVMFPLTSFFIVFPVPVDRCKHVEKGTIGLSVLDIIHLITFILTYLFIFSNNAFPPLLLGDA